MQATLFYEILIIIQVNIYTHSSVLLFLCPHCIFMLNRYKIEDLPAEKLYVVSVMLSVCTETSGCEANHTIFNKLMLPKQPCQWDEGFMNSSLYIYFGGILFN